MKLYYLENVERGVVGNSILWWAMNDNGYTCDLTYAKRFTASEVVEILNESGNKFKAWETDFVDPLIQRHIDTQDLHAEPKRTQPHTTHYGIAFEKV